MENCIKGMHECRQIIADVMEKDIGEIQDDTNLKYELGMSSLEFINAIIKIEKVYKISIPDQYLELDDKLTFGVLYSYVEKLADGQD